MIIAAAAAICVIVGYLPRRSTTNAGASAVWPAFPSIRDTRARSDDAVLIAGNRHYYLQLASTSAEKRQGLGGRASLPVSNGMLFVWRSSGPRCFWMNGMQFPLDMIWLSRTGRVVSVERDLLPKSYPAAYCAVSEDVVELDAGQAQAAGIDVGKTVKLEMPVR